MRPTTENGHCSPSSTLDTRRGLFNGSVVQIVIALVLMILLIPVTASAGGFFDNGDDDHVCSFTAYLAFRACGKDREDDYLITKANCLNIVNNEARHECLSDARAERYEAAEECAEVFDARKDLCGQLGEAAYDVADFWVAENFVDPLQIGNGIAPNPYFPLTPGQSVYEGGDETITVSVTTKTKAIGGVTCLVVNDVAEEEGQVIEDTDDWYAQDIYGNVWYCGEISKNYEVYDGDVPADPELVDIEGSWKGFREMAMPGVLIKANPQIGDIYRQEMALGDAEDVAEVIANTASGLLEGDFCEEDGDTIAEYIASMCNNDCLVTNEFTPLEPGVFEHKYYAPGVGLILETNPEGECVVPEGVI